MRAKTSTASFRLDDVALKALQGDAKKQDVSVNALLNQLVLTYSDYDRPMKRFQMVKIPALTFRHIIQGAKEDRIRSGFNGLEFQTDIRVDTFRLKSLTKS